jgi:hypothetical protein
MTVPTLADVKCILVAIRSLAKVVHSSTIQIVSGGKLLRIHIDAKWRTKSIGNAKRKQTRQH